jgi:hypothetical protein
VGRGKEGKGREQGRGRESYLTVQVS